MCMGFVCVYVCASCVCLVVVEVRRGWQTLKTGVTNSYEQPCGCWLNLEAPKWIASALPLSHLSSPAATWKWLDWSSRYQDPNDMKSRKKNQKTKTNQPKSKVAEISSYHEQASGPVWRTLWSFCSAIAISNKYSNSFTRACPFPSPPMSEKEVSRDPLSLYSASSYII